MRNWAGYRESKQASLVLAQSLPTTFELAQEALHEQGSYMYSVWVMFLVLGQDVFFDRLAKHVHTPSKSLE